MALRQSASVLPTTYLCIRTSAPYWSSEADVIQSRKGRPINQKKEIPVQVLRERLTEQWAEMPTGPEAANPRPVDSTIYFAA